MASSLATMPWLLARSPEVSARARAARSHDEMCAALQHGLSGADLTILARRIGALSDSPWQPMTVGLAGSCTTQLLAPALVASAYRHRLNLNLREAAFGQIMQTVGDPGFLAGLDGLILHLDARHLPGLNAALGASHREAVQTVEAMLAHLEEFSGFVILNTVTAGPVPLFGNLDRAVESSGACEIAAFNAELARLCRGSSRLRLFDQAGVASLWGLADWHDARLYHTAKLPFSPEALPFAADRLAALLASQVGLARKCLVLDLDNTLWGGVIGDDGLDGIVLGQGHAAGEAHLAVQRLAKDLAARGIILAVCSKNDERVALSAFESHPEMLLKREDIACFVANWQNKADNLREIARRLNIGVDALAFLDDNPAERGLVRDLLPEVQVIEVGDDPALYPMHVALSGAFESVAFTEDDRSRTSSYAADVSRATERASAQSLSNYLRSLDMVLDMQPFGAVDVPRIAQLINKSNQFNLTTRRYSEDVVARIAQRPDLIHLSFRLNDRFGPSGLIAVIIGKVTGRSA